MKYAFKSKQLPNRNGIHALCNPDGPVYLPANLKQANGLLAKLKEDHPNVDAWVAVTRPFMVLMSAPLAREPRTLETPDIEAMTELVKELAAQLCDCDFPPKGESGIIYGTACRARAALRLKPSVTHTELARESEVNKN